MSVDAETPRTTARPLHRGWELGLLFVILVAAAWLRLDGLGAIEPWIDEYGTSWAIAGDGVGETWRRVVSVQGQSPLFYVGTLLTRDLVPDPDLGLRAFSLLCGFLLVPAVWWLGHALLRARRAALGAALVVAVDERMIYYAQEARPYSLALLCSVLSMIAFAAWCERDRPLTRALCVAGALATWYAHYLFGMLLLIQALYVIAARPNGRAGRRGWAWVTGAFGVLAVPGLIQFAALFGRRESLDWIGESASLSGRIFALVSDLLLFLAPWATALSVPVALAVSWGSLGPREAARARPGLALLWFLLPSMVCGILPPLFGVNLAHHRYVMLAAPAGLLLIGAALALPRRGDLRDVLPALAFVLASFVMILAPTHEACGVWSKRVSQGWREATERLVAGWEPGDHLLYRTGFVELDAIVLGDASADVEGFASWPIVAHLPPGLRMPRHALPFNPKRPELVDRVKALIDLIWHERRTWIVGSGAYVPELAEWITAHPDFELLRNERVGIVHLLLFAKKR